jgi:hypothetical protein
MWFSCGFEMDGYCPRLNSIWSGDKRNNLVYRLAGVLYCYGKSFTPMRLSFTSVCVLTLLAGQWAERSGYALTVMTWNVSGSSANWNTNSLQVQALGRQVAALMPDILRLVRSP